MQQTGVNAKVLIGEESAFKTVATVGFVMPVNSCGVKGVQALSMAQTLTGTRNPVAPFAGNRDVSGSIVVPADSLAMPYWLQKMFGDPATTGADPYVHEYKIGATMPSFTLEEQFLDLAVAKYARFLGCMVSGWSMTVGGDGELVSNIDIIGASESLQTASFDAAPTTISLARVENFQAAVTEGGGALSNAREVSFSIAFGLDTDQFVIGGSGVRGSVPVGIVGVSGNVKTLFEDTTLLDKAIAGTESGLKITITSGASSILEVEIQELRYERNTPDIPGPQGLLADLNFQGYYTDGGEASAIVARVTNGVASY